MKKSILILLLFLCLYSKAQYLRCLTTQGYTIESQAGEKKINSPASVCYYGKYFSFYTKMTGTRTFEVADITKSKDNKGLVTETFMNAENETNMYGDYNVSINYGVTKTIVINFTRFGQAYVIQSSHFLGSPYENVNTKNLAIKVKTGQSPIINKPSYMMDFNKRFLDSCKISFRKGISQIKCLLSISKDGEVTDIKIKSMSVASNEPESALNNKIVSTIKNMPIWVPAMDNEKHYVASNIEVVIKQVN